MDNKQLEENRKAINDFKERLIADLKNFSDRGRHELYYSCEQTNFTHTVSLVYCSFVAGGYKERSRLIFHIPDASNFDIDISFAVLHNNNKVFCSSFEICDYENIFKFDSENWEKRSITFRTTELEDEENHTCFIFTPTQIIHYYTMCSYL